MSHEVDQSLLRDLSVLMETSWNRQGNVDIERIAINMTMTKVMIEKILNRVNELEREKQKYIDRKSDEINTFLRRVHANNLDNIKDISEYWRNTRYKIEILSIELTIVWFQMRII